MFLDSTYIFVIIAMGITLAAQGYMTATFNKFQNIGSSSGLTASDAAKIILEKNGIYDVRIGRVAGNLTDHYIPSQNVLNLSDTTYNSRSIASIGVAAHEAGHAIQDYKKMALLRFQMSIVPVVNIASKLSIPLIIIGMLLSLVNLIDLGIILFSATLFYQLVTLPIEFNASNNAIITLRETGIMNESELAGVKQVLTAAALTYVAAAASTVLQLLRFVVLSRGARRRN